MVGRVAPNAGFGGQSFLPRVRIATSERNILAPDGTRPDDEDTASDAGEGATHEKARTGAETAERIAECAAELFAQKGYAATSIREITEAAKVTKPTLYYHFGSKDGLIRHLVEGTLGAYASHLEEMATRTDYEVALRELVQQQFEFGESHPAIVTLLVRLDVQRPENLDFDLEAAQMQNHFLLERFFSAGVEAGAFRGEPRFLAMSFVGMMISHLMVRVRFPDAPFGPPARAAHDLISLLLDGARAPDASGPTQTGETNSEPAC